MRGTSSAALLVAILVAVSGGASRADDGHEIRRGAVSLGASGSFASVEGSTSGSFGLSLRYHRTPGGFVVGYHAGWDYVRVVDLDLIDLAAGVRAMKRIGRSSAYPYVGAVAGVRQEWVGSFSQGRFPVGVDIGLTALPSASATFGAGYEFRRVTGDPVADFNEHRLVVTMSILFRNE